MELEIFTIYDSAAKAYLPPFFMPNQATAERRFKQSCSDPQHQFCIAAEDYTLMSVGWFDDTKGEIDYTPPEKVLTGLEAKAHGTAPILTGTEG